MTYAKLDLTKVTNQDVVFLGAQNLLKVLNGYVYGIAFRRR